MSSHLLIKNNGQVFALDIARIKEILPLKGRCEYPSSSPHLVGGVNVRGEVLPLYDLRKIFGNATLYEERVALVEMLEVREKEHIEWMDSLETSIREDVEFKKAKDPTQCAFGKWLYSYKPNDSAVERILSHFEDPHKEMHSLAEQLLSMNDKEEALSILKVKRATTLSTMLRLFAELKVALVDDIRQLFLVLNTRSLDPFAISVDSVELLADLPKAAPSKGSHRLVSGVWTTEKDVIYEINHDALDEVTMTQGSVVSIG